MTLASRTTLAVPSAPSSGRGLPAGHLQHRPSRDRPATPRGARRARRRDRPARRARGGRRTAAQPAAVALPAAAAASGIFRRASGSAPASGRGGSTTSASSARPCRLRTPRPGDATVHARPRSVLPAARSALPSASWQSASRDDRRRAGRNGRETVPGGWPRSRPPSVATTSRRSWSRTASGRGAPDPRRRQPEARARPRCSDATHPRGRIPLRERPGSGAPGCQHLPRQSPPHPRRVAARANHGRARPRAGRILNGNKRMNANLLL